MESNAVSSDGSDTSILRLNALLTNVNENISPSFEHIKDFFDNLNDTPDNNIIQIPEEDQEKLKESFESIGRLSDLFLQFKNELNSFNRLNFLSLIDKHQKVFENIEKTDEYLTKIAMQYKKSTNN